MTEAPETGSIPDLGDEYRILRVLGTGGMGTVYLAHDVRHDRQVAIKTIRSDFVNPEIIERFEREIKLTARLQHPRILPLLDSGMADGALYYVMQYVDGESLEQRIAREGQLPLDEALRITRQVADALEYAHEHDIVHRDVKPANIMLTGGHALVMDFGIARAFETGSDGLTSAGTAIGTPAYMSPEHVSDATVVDGRSDIYSLGCVLYEMLAGQPPFTGHSIDSILRQQLAAQPTRIDVHRSTVGTPVRRLLDRALAKAPADRFRNAAEMVRAIETVTGGHAVPEGGLLAQLRQRRLVQFITAYAAGGWVLLEVIDQLAGNGVVPGFLYQVALVLLACGLPGVFIVAWFHGARGDQRAPAMEWALLAGVGFVALVAGTITVRRGLASAAPGPAPLEALAATEDPRRIAVTYFGADEESEFLAAGLTEALIDELSAVDALHVVSRNGVAPYRDQPVSSDSLGRALQVGSVVEGQVTQSDSIVRVRVSLVQAADGKQFDSRRLEAPKADLFELQDRLAAQVAEFLRQALGQEIQLIERQAGTDNVAAWELVQRAEALDAESERLSTLGDVEAASVRLDEADSLLAEAERLAPDWIEPVQQRGWLHYRHARLGGFDREWNAPRLAAGMEQASRALAKDAENADALELRGTIQYWRYLINLTETPGEGERLLQNARSDLQAAVQANPQQATAHTSLAHLYLNTESAAQAKLAAERSYQADPYLRTANVTLWRLISAALDLDDPVEVRKWCEEGRRRFEDDFRFRECRVWLYTMRGQTPDIPHAWQLCDELADLTPVGSRELQKRRCHTAVAMALIRAGLADSARRVFERTRAGSDIDPLRELALFEAMGRGWLGDNDEAFDLLARYLAANPGLAGHWAPTGWWWEDLSADPRWEQLSGAN